MFFVLSKTIGYLLQPLVIIGLLIIGSIVIRKSWIRRWSRILAIVFFFLFTNEFVANEVMRLWEQPGTPFKEISKTYEWGILLTGVARAQVQPSDRVHFARGADRAYHTVQLYKLGVVKKILVSGGTGRLLDIGEREADDLAQALIVMGVAQSDIAIEAASRNTYESAIAVKEMLAPLYQPEQCLLITSGFHLPRALACFRKAGWAMDTFSAEIRAHDRIYSFDTLFIPKTEPLIQWQTLLKEWWGMLAYKLAGYI